MIRHRMVGLDEALRHIDDLATAPKIRFGCASEGYHVDEKGRNEAANSTILNSQAKKYGRDPFFTNYYYDYATMREVVEMANAWMARNVELVYRKANDAARMIVESVRYNIDRGYSQKTGTMMPLKDWYAAVKKNKWKAGDKPILVRTGQLLRSLVPSVKVKRT